MEAVSDDGHDDIVLLLDIALLLARNVLNLKGKIGRVSIWRQDHSSTVAHPLQIQLGEYNYVNTHTHTHTRHTALMLIRQYSRLTEIQSVVQQYTFLDHFITSRHNRSSEQAPLALKCNYTLIKSYSTETNIIL